MRTGSFARGRRGFAVGIAAGAIVASVTASAAAAPPASNKATPTLTRRRGNGVTFAETARERMKNGDCAGALDAFDEAIQRSADPTLRRDRGLCHEKLREPYPAIDDYRVYLTAYPEAPDADDIRTRVERLQAKTGTGPTSTDDDDADGNANGAQENRVLSEPSTPIVLSGAGTAETHEDRARLKRDARAVRTIDRAEAAERRDEEANASPLRRGRGLAVGAELGVRGASKDGRSEVVAAAVRYAFSGRSTIAGEVGYMSIDGTGTASSASGLSTLLGYEYRIPLEAHVDNAIFLLGGVGYERATRAGTNALLQLELVRLRAGFRHVFGPGLGLEGAFEASFGSESYQATGVTFGSTSTSSESAGGVQLFGLYVALVSGM